MKNNDDFLLIIDDILQNKKFNTLKNIQHHGKNNNTYEHSYRTALCAYKLGMFFKFSNTELISVTRAAMLHDFFCYDWRLKEYKKQFGEIKGIEKAKYSHAFIHPQIACENAKKYFNISDKQADAIKNHMFPLTLTLPHYKEGWIVTLADKVIATKEICATCINFFKNKE